MALNVLVVDDDFINRKLLENILKKHDEVIEILEAENGEDALAKIASNPQINMILLDIIMPIIDGMEFLKKFRADMKYTNIPVIILSTDDTKKTEALNHGANDFLRKPIKEEDLKLKIKMWTAD
ncbi:MAG: response regulator [Campylobacterales bacterium]|nr:response regulator [Campylobacterales bacterium]